MLPLLDPPKESAGKAIAALRDNGVAVKVLTGDNPVVTARICLEVGNRCPRYPDRRPD